jgi:hypothetical protein
VQGIQQPRSTGAIFMQKASIISANAYFGECHYSLSYSEAFRKHPGFGWNNEKTTPSQH